ELRRAAPAVPRAAGLRDGRALPGRGAALRDAAHRGGGRGDRLRRGAGPGVGGRAHREERPPRHHGP
ncbi:MAG: hypothetical protein AVDCRST_MAG40-1365, partial [uncultured Gemmatimonadaceae bacterium]